MTAHSAGAGSANGSSGEGGDDEGGMWLALSQIQEWVVEFGCDMLLISFRTDVAWYRLTKCALAAVFFCNDEWPGLVQKLAISWVLGSCLDVWLWRTCCKPCEDLC
jgi:hypothetical protein